MIQDNCHVVPYFNINTALIFFFLSCLQLLQCPNFLPYIVSFLQLTFFSDLTTEIRTLSGKRLGATDTIRLSAGWTLKEKIIRITRFINHLLRASKYMYYLLIILLYSN